MDVSKILPSFKEIFPKAHIRLIDETGRVIEETLEFPQDLPPEIYHSSKEILSVPVSEKSSFYKLSFPLPPSHQLSLYLSPHETMDILTAAKMSDNVIQLFLSRPLQNVQSARQNDTALLLDHLLHPSNAQQDSYTAILAAELGFDMSLPRAVCIFQINGISSSIEKQPPSAQSVLQLIQQITALDSQDIFGVFGNRNLILCHVMNQGLYRDKEYLKTLYAYITKNFPVTCQLGIGLTATDIRQYHLSFLSAQKIFQYTKNSQYNGPSLYHTTDFLPEQLTYELPDAFFEHFFQKELSYLQSTPFAPETLKALVDHNMDILSSAKALFIHRNTMIFRLNQIKRQLGINPLHRDSDRFKLILLYHYYAKNYMNKENV